MTITITGKTVVMGWEHMPVDKFCQLIADKSAITGMRADPIPDNVRWIAESGDHAVYVVELQPELRTVNWADYYDDDDEEHEAQKYTIATPYVILRVPFYKNIIKGCVEVFYRNAPLKSIDDELYRTNLRNVCMGDGIHYYASLCIDGLQTDSSMSRNEVLNELVNHLWSGEFNKELGSEFECMSHEDKRLSSIERWQKESIKDPKFVLGVKWLPAMNTCGTPHQATVKDSISLHFKHYTGGTSPASATALGNLMLKGK